MQPVAWVVLSLAVLLVAAPPVLIVSLLKERRRNFASEARAASLGDEVEIFRKRFPEIFNLDSEISRLKAEIDLLEQERSSLFAKNKADKDEQERMVADIRSQYKEKKSVYDRLIGEIAIFDERLAFAEMG